MPGVDTRDEGAQMQISGIAGNAGAQRMHGTDGGPPPPGGRGGPQKLAEALGVSMDALKAARDSGTTLTELAASKGISKDDLVATIVDRMTGDRKDSGAPAIPEEDLTAMITQMVDRVLGRGGPGAPGGGGSDPDGDGDPWRHHGRRGGDSGTSERLDEVA